MSWQDTLKTLAPTVATALGGPLAGAAVVALGELLGVPKASQEVIGKMFTDGQVTPEQLSLLRQLELKYQAEERERGFKYSELEFQDTANAREMQIKTESLVPPALAVLVTLGFFGILIFMVLSGEYKPTEPLLVMLGSLGTAWTMIIGFYFGSSHGSQRKDVLMAQAQAKNG